MKGNIKLIIGIIIGALISGVTIYAATQLYANQISYKDGTVEDALNDIYTKIDVDKVCMFISNQYGSKGQIGAKYVCNPGDGNTYIFYLLKKDGNQVKLIMEKNITDSVGSNVTMSWTDAIAFFSSGHAGYATKQAWNKVINVDLPDAQDIVDATLVVNPKNDWSFNAATSEPTWWCLGSHEQDQPSGPLYCPSNTTQQKAGWLFGYTRGCASRGCVLEYSDSNSYPYGYWTNNLSTNSNNAWNVFRNGYLGYDTVSNTSNYGVRPVITVLASEI